MSRSDGLTSRDDPLPESRSCIAGTTSAVERRRPVTRIARRASSRETARRLVVGRWNGQTLGMTLKAAVTDSGATHGAVNSRASAYMLCAQPALYAPVMARARQRPRIASTSSESRPERVFPFAAKAATGPPSPIEHSIFDATEDLLTGTALDDLTVAQILERADISRTTFYRYFTSKHQVVSAMLEALQAELMDVMQPWFARGDRPPEQALLDAIKAVAKVWARHRPVLRACSEHWHADPEIGERWVAMMERFTTDISRQIDRERKAGAAPRGVDSHKLALHLTWGSERMFYLAGFGLAGDRLEDEAVDAIVATWLGAVYHR